ncbi:hypothetical protein X777_04936, partial [Ooceraea biroi]
IFFGEEENRRLATPRGRRGTVWDFHPLKTSSGLRPGERNLRLRLEGHRLGELTPIYIQEENQRSSCLSTETLKSTFLACIVMHHVDDE